MSRLASGHTDRSLDKRDPARWTGSDLRISGGRSRVRTWVGLADGFTDISQTCPDLRLCSALPDFSGHLPRHPRSRCRPPSVAHPMRPRTTPEGYLLTRLTRQADEAPSNARAPGPDCRDMIMAWAERGDEVVAGRFYPAVLDRGVLAREMLDRTQL